MSNDFDTGEEGTRSNSEPRNSQSDRRQADAPRAQPQADRRAQERVAPSINSLNRFQPRPLLGNANDAVLSTIIDSFIAAAEKNADPTAPASIRAENWKFLPFDSVSNGVALGSVIITLLVPTGGERLALNFVVVIDRPGVLSTREEEWRGRRYDVIRTPSDVMTETYLAKVDNLVTQAHQATRNAFCGFFVLPYEAAVTLTKENINGTAQVLAGAMDAVCSTLEIVLRDDATYQPFSLTWFDRDDRLEIVPNLSGQPVVDAVGIPARADLLLTSSHVTPSPEDDTPIRTPLVETAAMLTLDYAPESTGNQSGFGRRLRQQEEQPFWQPILTITALNRRTAQFSLQQALLGIASLAPVSDDYWWLNLLRPVEGQQDLRDIGYLPVLSPTAEAEDRKYVKGLTAGISDTQLQDYLGDLVKQDLAYAIDVPDSTENSWLMNTFAGVAKGNADDLKLLIQAANDLTDGHFSDVMDRLDPNGNLPFADSSAGHLLGWYTNQHGETRDLRELDTLAVLTRSGEKNPDVALDWQDTFDHTNIPQDIREADRMRIIERLVGGVRVIGRAQRYYVNPVFVKALAEAVRMTGVKINMVNQPSSIATRQHGNTLAANFATRDAGRGMLTSRRGDRDRDDRDRGRRSSLYDGRRNY